MMASHHETEIEGTEEKVTEAEHNLDSMAEQVQNLNNFNNFTIKWLLNFVIKPFHFGDIFCISSFPFQEYIYIYI